MVKMIHIVKDDVTQLQLLFTDCTYNQVCAHLQAVQGQAPKDVRTRVMNGLLLNYIYYDKNVYAYDEKRGYCLFVQ